MRLVTTLHAEAIFTLEMPLSKPIGNQTPAMSELTSLVTAATLPMSHYATNTVSKRSEHYPL